MLPNGHLAKHGYTLLWGFFSGTCPGSDELPFEISTDLIARSIKSAEDNKTTIKGKTMIEVLSNTTKWFYHRITRPEGFQHEAQSYWTHVDITEFADPSDYSLVLEDADDFIAEKIADENFCRHPRFDNDPVIELVFDSGIHEESRTSYLDDTEPGNVLGHVTEKSTSGFWHDYHPTETVKVVCEGAVREQNSEYCKELEKQVVRLDEYVARQRVRLEGWTPQPLLPR
tara:strand:+ start:9002 stop:9685 length:684 start_codon:yes stop_codon:yes gene_type:complete